MRFRRVLLPAAAAVTLMFLSTGAAHAIPPPTPPRFIAGNVTTCEDAVLSGTILFEGMGNASGEAGSGVVTDGGLFLDVTINAGWTASGVAVKGGDNSNVYDGPFVGLITIEDMRAPNNMGGQQPQISHWFVCGERTPPPPPGTPTPPPPGTPTPPPPGTPTPTPPAGGGTPTPSGPAKTGGGGSQGGTSWFGIAALVTAAASAGFLMLRRKRI